ncbi:MAG: multidrug efflux SMR transporter [Planctomycetota bacterium]
MAWIWLLVAGMFEVGFTTCLKLSEGFSRPWWTVGFVATSAVSFVTLTIAIKTIPLGTAYAIWTGIGAFGTAMVGILAFGETTTALRLLFLGLLIASIVGLKLVSVAH